MTVGAARPAGWTCSRPSVHVDLLHAPPTERCHQEAARDRERRPVRRGRPPGQQPRRTWTGIGRTGRSRRCDAHRRSHRLASGWAGRDRGRSAAGAASERSRRRHVAARWSALPDRGVRLPRPERRVLVRRPAPGFGTRPEAVHAQLPTVRPRAVRVVDTRHPCRPAHPDRVPVRSALRGPATDGRRSSAVPVGRRRNLLDRLSPRRRDRRLAAEAVPRPARAARGLRRAPAEWLPRRNRHPGEGLEPGLRHPAWPRPHPRLALARRTRPGRQLHLLARSSRGARGSARHPVRHGPRSRPALYGPSAPLGGRRLGSLPQPVAAWRARGRAVCRRRAARDRSAADRLRRHGHHRCLRPAVLPDPDALHHAGPGPRRARLPPLARRRHPGRPAPLGASRNARARSRARKPRVHRKRARAGLLLLRNSKRVQARVAVPGRWRPRPRRSTSRTTVASASVSTRGTGLETGRRATCSCERPEVPAFFTDAGTSGSLPG